MPKFRRKPVIVDADQFDPDVLPWPKGVVEYNKHWTAKQNSPRNFGLSGEQDYAARVRPGDWIVTNQTGERYVVRQEFFRDVFEPE